jgi:hypothetical protein
LADCRRCRHYYAIIDAEISMIAAADAAIFAAAIATPLRYGRFSPFIFRLLHASFSLSDADAELLFAGFRYCHCHCHTSFSLLATAFDCASAAMMPLQLAIISPLLAPFSPVFSLSLPAGQRHAIAAFTPPLYALPPADMLLILTPYANFAFRFRHLAFLCRWLSFMPRRHFRRFRRCRRLISPLSC